MIDTINVKFATRQLLKRPGFTAGAVLCLALGTGAATCIFSVVNAVLLRPLPYAEPERLARIYTEFPTFPNGGLRRFAFSNPEYFDLRREATSWESIDGWMNNGVNLAAATEPIRVTATLATGGMLRSLGVAPTLGRAFTTEDDQPGAPRVANISHGLWQRAFAGDPGVVGREILINGDKCTVVGVMPKGFQFPPGEMDATEVWSPLQLDSANAGSRSGHSLNVLGRLKPGVTLDRARAELAALVKHWGESGSGHRFDSTNHTLVTFGMHDEIVRGVRPALRMLLGAVGFLLLIGCVNVANLLLARAESRQRELAIRGALGAGLGRLALQFVMEGILLSIIGVAAGMVLAQGGLAWIKSASADSLPLASAIGIDGRVILFAVAVSLATGVVFGLAPLVHVMKRDLHIGLKESANATTGAAGTQRFRHALVVGELGLALTLLIGAGLMLRAFWNLQDVDAGFQSRNVVTMLVNLPQATYRSQELRDFWTRLDARLRALPGVESAAFASGLPPVYQPMFNDTRIEGFVPTEGGPIENVDFYQIVSRDYFDALRIRLAEGRLFDERDGLDDPPVAVINQTMARTFWGSQSPIGRRIRPSGTTNWSTVIGVIADTKNGGLDKPTGSELYLPVTQEAGRGLRSANVVLRSQLDPSTVVGAVRRVVRDMDPTLPLARVRTMDDVVSAAQSRPRLLSLLLTLFSGVAVALAAVGIYGVISYSVAQRTKEFGIRMALGAQRGDVLAIVLGRGMFLALAGIGIGLIGAFTLTRFLSTLLFGVTPTDPVTFLAVSILLGTVAFLASYIPARRATKVDPTVALRCE